MSYYAALDNADFSIPAGNLDAAYAAMVALNDKRDDLLLSWMPSDYPDQYNNAGEIFTALGFDVEYNIDGDLLLVSYSDNQGDEGHFLRAVAPFVRDGSSLTWRGEEGEVWMEIFRGGQIRTYDANITWVERSSGELL